MSTNEMCHINFKVPLNWVWFQKRFSWDGLLKSYDFLRPLLWCAGYAFCGAQNIYFCGAWIMDCCGARIMDCCGAENKQRCWLWVTRCKAYRGRQAESSQTDFWEYLKQYSDKDIKMKKYHKCILRKIIIRRSRNMMIVDFRGSLSLSSFCNWSNSLLSLWHRLSRAGCLQIWFLGSCTTLIARTLGQGIRSLVDQLDLWRNSRLHCGSFAKKKANGIFHLLRPPWPGGRMSTVRMKAIQRHWCLQWLITRIQL